MNRNTVIVSITTLCMLLVILGTLLTFSTFYGSPFAVLDDYQEPASDQTQELSLDWDDLTLGTTIVHIEKIEPKANTVTTETTNVAQAIEPIETETTVTEQQIPSTQETKVAKKEQTALEILLADIETAIDDINDYDRYLEKYQDAVQQAEDEDDLDEIDDDMDDLRDDINDLDGDLDDIRDRFDDMDYRDYDDYDDDDFDTIQHRIESTFENFGDLKEYFNDVNEELNDRYDVI